MSSFNFGWKSIVALGVSIATIIFASKMDGAAAERVSIHAIDATRDCVVACKGKR